MDTPVTQCDTVRDRWGGWLSELCLNHTIQSPTDASTVHPHHTD